MVRRDPTDNTTVVHVGPRASLGSVKVGRITGIKGLRRHVDIGFSLPDGSGDLTGVRWACLTRTQARTLAKVIATAAK